MPKIAICADVHFGVPGRLADIEWSMRTIREYCRLAGIEVIIILGDLFHDRRAIEIDVLNTAISFFEKAANEYNQEWVVFPGNHDMFLRHSWDINSLALLRKHLTVIEDIKLCQIYDQRFWILPFITYERAYVKVASKIQRMAHPDDILLTHIGVRGAILNTCFLLKDWSEVAFWKNEFYRIYTGHFHSRQQVNENIFYPGSPIPFKFDEGDVPHGFYVYDTVQRDHKFIDIWKAGSKFFPDETPPPQMITLDLPSLEGLDTSVVKHNLIRIAVDRDMTMNEKSSIRETLLQAGAKGVRWMDLTKKIQSQDIISAAPTRDLFKSWVEQDEKGTQKLNKGLLYTLNQEIMTMGDQLYTVEAADD